VKLFSIDHLPEPRKCLNADPKKKAETGVDTHSNIRKSLKPPGAAPNVRTPVRSLGNATFGRDGSCSYAAAGGGKDRSTGH